MSNNHFDNDVNIDGEIVAITTSSSDIINPTITLTDDVTIDDEASGKKPPVIDLMIIDDTISSNHYIRINDSETSNNTVDSSNVNPNTTVTDDDINGRGTSSSRRRMDSNEPTRMNTSSIPSRGGNTTTSASADSTNLQYLLEKQNMTKLQLAQTNLKSVKQFRLQNEKLYKELEIAYRKRKEIEGPLQEAMTLIEILEG